MISMVYKIEMNLYKPHFFFVTATLAPFVVGLGTLYLYYKYNDRAKLSPIPRISEIGADLPASRMFTVGMTVAAWFTMPLYIIINQCVRLKRRIAKCESKIAAFIINVLGAMSFFSYIGIGSVTIRDNRQLHYLIFAVFILSHFFYFVAVDMGLKSRICHFLWAFVSPISYFGSFLVSGRASSILQYVGAAALFCKWPLLWSDLPNTGVMLAKRN